MAKKLLKLQCVADQYCGRLTRTKMAAKTPPSPRAFLPLLHQEATLAPLHRSLSWPSRLAQNHLECGGSDHLYSKDQFKEGRAASTSFSRHTLLAPICRAVRGHATGRGQQWMTQAAVGDLVSRLNWVLLEPSQARCRTCE